jgi:ATP-dependent helicase/nuclease subunit A
VLNPVLHPSETSRRNSLPAPGCPAFGEESVLERGPKGKRPAAGSVRPGLHKFAPDGAPVVWWDPASLDLEVEELAPLRHQRLLEMDAGGAAAVAGQQRYEAWKTQRSALLAKASEPSLSVQTVTSLTRAKALSGAVLHGSDSSTELAIDVQFLERGDVGRPGGRRFGSLVHALLALIDLSAGAEAVKAAASLQGRIVGATEEEIDAAVATVLRAVAHPLLRRAAAVAGNGGVRREIPVLLKMDDGSLVEGVVDLAFREEASDFAGWTVVDFKTDRELEGSSDRYLGQVQLYSMAVREATKLPTRGVLLVV